MRVAHIITIEQHWSKTVESLVKPGLRVAKPMDFSAMSTNTYLFCLSEFWLGFPALAPDSPS